MFHINFQNCDFITSYYTIIYQYLKDKDFLIKFLNLWIVAGFLFWEGKAPDARFQDIMSLIYNEFKIKNGFSSSEIIEKSKV